MAVVAQVFRVTTEQIFSKARAPYIVRARQVAMYVVRSRLEYSYPQIGKLFQRDHTTVISAVRKVEALKALGDKRILFALESTASYMTHVVRDWWICE